VRRQVCVVKIDWDLLAGLVGLALLCLLFLAVVVLSTLDRPLNHAEVMGFLGIITILIGLPSGIRIIRNGTKKRNGGGE
jgi:hypothetical protein